MKRKLILLSLSLFIGMSTYAQDTGSGRNEAVIAFDISSYDFGDIKQGDKVEYSFSFKNTGNQPLLVTNVLVQCGCTATDWPREPIASGKTGIIKVMFDSSGKTGMQHKVITIVSNATNTHERVKILTNILPE